MEDLLKKLDDMLILTSYMVEGIRKECNDYALRHPDATDQDVFRCVVSQLIFDSLYFWHPEYFFGVSDK